MKTSTLLLIFIYIISLNSFARVHQYETTRLKSTGGAGVASMLLDESAVLNPAPIAFFKSSALYLQKSNFEYTDQVYSSGKRNYTNNDEQESIIISDAKGSLKGSFGFQNQYEGGEQRKRYSSAMAGPIGPKSSMGFSYHYTRDYNRVDTINLEEEDYHQINAGVYHAISPEFSIGAVVNDILSEKEEDHRVILGMQYTLKGFITIMADAGSDYRKELSERFLYKTALQMKFYSDFHVRAGAFRDSFLKEKGNGAGVSWTGPKLMVDLALKNTTPYAQSQSSVGYEKKVKESSLSLSYIF